MQIVIEIPESIYDTIQSDEMINREQLAILQMHIMNGAPLPKGHGRLIDADALIDSLDASDRDIYCKAVIEEDAPTIIEADGGDAV